MPPPPISPNVTRHQQKDAAWRATVSHTPHTLLLSFISGKAAFEQYYEDDELLEALKTFPALAATQADLEDDCVFVLYNVLKCLENDLSQGLRLDIDRASRNMRRSLTQLEVGKKITRFIDNHSYISTLMILLSRGQDFYFRLLSLESSSNTESTDLFVKNIRRKDKKLLMTQSGATKGELKGARCAFERSYSKKLRKCPELSWLTCFIDDIIDKRLLTTYSTPRLQDMIQRAESTAKDALVDARLVSVEAWKIARGKILMQKKIVVGAVPAVRTNEPPVDVDMDEDFELTESVAHVNEPPIDVDLAEDFEFTERVAYVRMLKEKDIFPKIPQSSSPIHLCGIYSSMRPEDVKLMKTRVKLIEEMKVHRQSQKVGEAVFDAKAWADQFHKVFEGCVSDVDSGYKVRLESNIITGFQDMWESKTKDYVSTSATMIAFLRAEAVADGFVPGSSDFLPNSPSSLESTVIKRCCCLIHRALLKMSISDDGLSGMRMKQTLQASLCVFVKKELCPVDGRLGSRLLTSFIWLMKFCWKVSYMKMFTKVTSQRTLVSGAGVAGGGSLQARKPPRGEKSLNHVSPSLAIIMRGAISEAGGMACIFSTASMLNKHLFKGGRKRRKVGEDVGDTVVLVGDSLEEEVAEDLVNLGAGPKLHK